MATVSDDGSVIFSASEVGDYVVCPEAWRLRYLLRQGPRSGDTQQKGTQAHAAWSEDLNEAVYLSRALRRLAVLIALSAILYSLL